MTYYQSRVWASSPDEAVAVIRGKYPGAHHVSIKETHIAGWYEYGVMV